MPSKKPRIQALVNEEIYKKFKTLCDTDGRSESNLAGKIITDFIKDYEKQNGTINISTGDVTIGDNNNINIG